MKRRHAKLCREKEEKKKERKKLLEIKDRNKVLKYIKKERQQREQLDKDIKDKEWIKHFKRLLEGKEKRTQTKETKIRIEKNKETVGEKILT